MKKIFYGVVLALAFSSCEDYVDVNDKQSNNATFDAITPNQMLAGAINNYTSNQNITLASFGNRMAYVWGLNSGFTTTDAAYTYNFTSADYSANFESTYVFADNFQDIIDKKASFPNYSYHFGVAKVFKVMSMDYITALYGDVPYSQAFKSDITQPDYDDDKAIIPQLFNELDEARNYFNDTSASIVPLGTEDIVFAGDVSKWLQFVNTVELRLLMRLSKTTDPALVALRTSRFATLNAAQDFISEDVTVNPGYNHDTYAQRNPVFRVHGLKDGDAEWTSTNRANAAGDYVAKLVNGTLNTADVTTGVVDPRRSRMFSLVGGIVQGNVQGVFPSVAISRYSGFFMGRASVVDAADANNNGSIRDMFLMQAAESSFLQAEAMERGYLTGDAHAKFDEGIANSFNFYSTVWGTLPQAAYPALNATTYTNAILNKNGLGWNGAAGHISAIMTQKYLALAQWHGIELYIDHLRTGFPVLPIPVGATQSVRPKRLIYPASEYSSNSSNVPNVTNADLYTVNSKTPYYLQ